MHPCDVFSGESSSSRNFEFRVGVCCCRGRCLWILIYTPNYCVNEELEIIYMNSNASTFENRRKVENILVFDFLKEQQWCSRPTILLLFKNFISIKKNSEPSATNFTIFFLQNGFIVKISVGCMS